MNKVNLRCISFFLLFCLISFSVKSQQSSTRDLSNVHVSELSDNQVRQFIQQADAAGMTNSQIKQLAEQRGLPPDEANSLIGRIQNIRRFDNGSLGKTLEGGTDSTQSNRKLNYRGSADTLTNDRKYDVLKTIAPGIFGSEIFRTGNLTFAPDLKIATPINYVLGPEDQLNINIYGRSVANWKLDVSPDGNINIPSVGLLNVAGKTIKQAKADIERRLSAYNYSINKGTSVEVTLGNIRSIKVIVIGDVIKPGTYTLPSLATAFNALYSAGGPTDNGTFRKIEIIRDSKVISVLDIYDFLIKGSQKQNIGLHDQDIIRIPLYSLHVQAVGEVKQPAIFEVLPGETLADVLKFAGGFTDLAYTDQIKVLQVNNQQRRITDILENNLKTYFPKRGDKYIIDRILDRYENRVSIRGAIFRPGEYQLDTGLTLLQLIKKSAGLKEDAFTERANITRLKADNTRELIAIDLRGIIAKKSPDILLQREDSVYISSIFELRDRYTVTIKGEVRQPGEFLYADSMKVADLILKAGGFTQGASNTRIEVAQRKTNSDPHAVNSQVAVVYRIDLNEKFKLNQADFTLHPNDIVSVYKLPGYEKQRVVRIDGEILYPGYYIIKRKDEKISDIVARAGGLTASADPEGGSLRRSNASISGISKNKVIDTAALAKERMARLNHLKQTFMDTSLTDTAQMHNNYVGIDLKEILKKPGSITDLIMVDGDELLIPQKQQLVRINGNVLFPSAVVYQRSKTFKDYISNAGGFSPHALKRGAYIVYANGAVKGTTKFLFFNVHPAVEPGSEIYVPKRPVRIGTTQEIIGLTTGLASIGAIILGIISLRR